MANFLPVPGTPLSEVDTPALLVDLDALERNIEVCHSFFRNRIAKVRSVTKGHKCPAIAQLQMRADGAVPFGLACAKVSEAEIMVEAGCRDVRMIEQVVGKQKIARLMSLAQQARVTALVDDRRQVDDLASAAGFYRVPLDVMVEVDIGLRRCGVAPGRPAAELADYVAKQPRLRFKGLSGHESAAAIRDSDERTTAQRERFQRLLDSREAIERAGLPVDICAGGATVAWNVAGTMDGITEIEPGAYVLMDYGAKAAVPELEFGFALKVLATVISRPEKGRAVIDSGHKMIGLAYGGEMPGMLAPPGASVNRLNSEHGILDVTGEAEALRIGDKVELIPWYYGTAVNASDYYIGIRDDRVETTWRIAARGCHQ